MHYIKLNYDDKIIIQNDNIIFSIKEKQTTFRLTQLTKLSIITTDQGPFIDDVFLALFINDIIIFLPSEHTQYENTLFDELGNIFELDYQKIIRASSFTQNAEFIIYQK